VYDFTYLLAAIDFMFDFILDLECTDHNHTSAMML